MFYGLWFLLKSKVSKPGQTVDPKVGVSLNMKRELLFSDLGFPAQPTPANTYHQGGWLSPIFINGVFDLDHDELVWHFKVADHPLNCMKVDDTGTLICVGAADGSVLAFSLSSNLPFLVLVLAADKSVLALLSPCPCHCDQNHHLPFQICFVDPAGQQPGKL